MSNMRILSQLIGFFLLMSSCDDTTEYYNGANINLHKVFNLPGELEEASGIIIYDSLLWTFNDSGNEAVLYGIDTTDGKISKRIFLKDIRNIDWEDITQDEISIFIGDIGNGSGSRDTLNIYGIYKAEICDTSEQTISGYRISFIFEDQSDFKPALYATSFDCEALISIEDSLYIFTKDWVNSNTVLYSLPKTPCYYKAKRLTEIPVNGLVAGAGYNSMKNQIALCGYTENYVPFLTLANIHEDMDINEEELIRYDFFEDFGIQIEGIEYSGDRIFLVSEKSAQPQAFFEFR